MLIVKQDGDRRRMYIVASNAYRDREDEIVKEQALHDYVESFEGNDLLFWHRGAPIGEVVKAEMIGPFLIEEAVEADDRLVLTRAFDGKGMQVTTVKAIWDHIEANPDTFNAASIGFRYAAKDKADNSYSLIFKRETSVLPHWAAANPYTYSEVNKDE